MAEYVHVETDDAPPTFWYVSYLLPSLDCNLYKKQKNSGHRNIDWSTARIAAVFCFHSWLPQTLTAIYARGLQRGVRDTILHECKWITGNA
jgi:hypothetical protein